MHCNEFLRAYSDYRDGLITDARVVWRVREHLAECQRCRRYDRTVARGMSTLRAARVDPDPDAAARLQALATPAGHMPPVPAHAGVFAAVLVVAAFAVIAWDAVRGSAASAPPAAAASDPVPDPAVSAPPVVVANPGVPFIRFADFATPEAAFVQPSALSPVASSLTLYQGTSDR